ANAPDRISFFVLTQYGSLARVTKLYTPALRFSLDQFCLSDEGAQRLVSDPARARECPTPRGSEQFQELRRAQDGALRTFRGNSSHVHFGRRRRPSVNDNAGSAYADAFGAARPGLRRFPE